MANNWYGNEDHQALVDENSGLLLASIDHDGYGKFAVTVYVSLFSRFFWSEFREQIELSWTMRDYGDSRWSWWRHLRWLNWGCFPRFPLCLGDLKFKAPGGARSTDIEHARLAVEKMLGRDDHQIVIPAEKPT